MSDFDLIPTAYRQRLRVRAGVRAVGISVVLLAALVGIGRTHLNRIVDGREQQVERLRVARLNHHTLTEPRPSLDEPWKRSLV